MKMDKWEVYSNLYSNWLFVRNMGMNITQHPKVVKADRIVVYGLHNMGARVVEELELNKREVAYGIDKGIIVGIFDFDIYHTDDLLPEADLMIVTPVFFYDEIKKGMEKKFCGEIISLGEIIQDLRELL